MYLAKKSLPGVKRSRRVIGRSSELSISGSGLCRGGINQAVLKGFRYGNMIIKRGEKSVLAMLKDLLHGVQYRCKRVEDQQTWPQLSSNSVQRE